MLSASDFITLPYTPDMTIAGIKYACQSLAYTYDRMGGNRFDRLRRIVAGKAVELAFRRYLNEYEVPHDMLGSTPFTDPDDYDIAIGGRRCDIKSFMIAQKNRIRLIRKSPRRLLDAQALVPSDQIANDHLDDEDIYIFAFLTALLAPNQRTLQAAIEAQQPIYMIHALPNIWARPKRWISLGKLAIKSNATNRIKLELGGQNPERAFQTSQIILEPQKRTILQEDFCALNYLYTPNLPDKTIGIHSPTLKQTYLIEPIEWGNIWVYGMQIIFTGFITRGEFRQQAFRLPVGSRVFQYTRTRTENLALPIHRLYPLKGLFDQAKSRAQH